MAIFYPRKQTAIIFIVCLVVIIAAMYFSDTSLVAKKAKQLNDSSPVIAVKTDDTKTIKTLDGKDWKEQFFDVTKNSSAYKAEPQTEVTSIEEPVTVTDQFGRDFFARYMLLKQNNLTEDDESIKAVIDQSMDEIATQVSQPKLYFRKDILVSENSGPVAIKTYANAVGSLFYAKAPRENAALIASQALDANDPAELVSIPPIINSYTALLADLKRLPVPKELADHHIDLINGISAMLFVSDGMNKVFTDPIQSLVALNLYGTAQDALRGSLLQFKIYFADNKISFTPAEYGSFFATIK
ncbi:MAG: hypothetical protein WC648_03910 [Candidatus Paceibacterota bacterium]|jgi:hypothetical protein